jgi:signal transduction histidine kinase
MHGRPLHLPSSCAPDGSKPPRTLSRTAGLVLVLIGGTVLAGWALGIDVLKGLSGEITMKPNAAVGLLAAGISLVLLGARSRTARALGQACAVLAGATGALTLAEHLGGWNFGIDQLLFLETPGAAATTSPGRMGPNCALSLTCSGVALLCLYRSTERTILVAQLLGASVTVLALVPTVGYVYGAEALYAIAKYTGIAFHTGVALLVLSVGLLAARSDKGPVAALTTDAPFGVVARRLLTAAILVPLLVGYLRVQGERVGFYDSPLGAALFVVTMIVMLSILIWRAAVAFGRSDRELRAVQQEREELLVRERGARQKAEQADRAKDEFIAALSHELRTPLNAILGWMYMLQKETVPDASRMKATDVILRNAGVLSRLIEDLLDTSRITTGHLVLVTTPLDVRGVVQAAVDSILPSASARNVGVVLSLTPAATTVNADAQRLQQVVWNLLSNAIKFTPSGRNVHLTLASSNGEALIIVKDEGEGIDPVFLPHVFDRLWQGDASSTRVQGGLGLGLFIARQLTILHGGTLDASSDGRGTGATFTVRLPEMAAAVNARPGMAEVPDVV